ncbi:LysR substrate-binding domain-containing protein [Duganella sp. HH101]|uniref:LysR family transcriptional regulator n=1 Tax=Duganella sp. HH101 TaxID=1781066 RepID=UPI000874E1C1|nr:LysR substrate-binding domain-containing protein [Duganella sp. HH101]OFA02915.1 HTH-type transcriptional regulator BenM [Duganella sp. HH101]OFA02960.1 HTH-type transcriptional regulator BenM [Duganella sp. HH101]
MRKLDTHALEIFVAVAQCLNFRQAAEQLHMTQPPLSRAVRQLEERLGTRLFERDTQHVALTPAAAELLPRALRILALLEQAEQALQTRQPATRLRLGMTSSMESDLFRAFTDGVTAAIDGAALDTVFDASPRLVARLRARRLDAAIIALPTKTFDLPVLQLGKQPTLVALASRHPLAKRRSLSLADLQDQPVYWFERARQPAFFDHSHAVFRRHGFAPRFLLEPHDHHVLLSDVAAGKGMALLPASFAAISRGGVSYRKLKEGDELAAGLGLIVADGHPAAAVLRRLAAETLG